MPTGKPVDAVHKNYFLDEIIYFHVEKIYFHDVIIYFHDEKIYFHVVEIVSERRADAFFRAQSRLCLHAATAFLNDGGCH